MASSITKKIEQDISLFEICMNNKDKLHNTKNKIYKTEFWNSVQADYNAASNDEPKTVKQLRERFKYLYRSFEKNHRLELKYNRSLHKDDFIKENREMLEAYEKATYRCFHTIKYNENTQLVLVEERCTKCNYHDEPVKGELSALTYQQVYEMEVARYQLKSSEKMHYSYTQEVLGENVFQEIEDYIHTNPINFFNVKNGKAINGMEDRMDRKEEYLETSSE